MHLTNSLILFYICGRISSSVFNSIQVEISQNGNHPNLLRKAIHDYAINCDTIEAINRCFGWICLVATTFFLISFINGSFFLFGSFDFLYAVVFFFNYLVHLAAMCYTADDLRHQVASLIIHTNKSLN